MAGSITGTYYLNVSHLLLGFMLITTLKFDSKITNKLS